MRIHIKRGPFFEKLLTGLGTVCILGTAGIVWLHILRPPTPQPRPPCSVANARAFGRLLKGFARDERVRAWADNSLASRQAAWLAVKAEYILSKTKILDGKSVPSSDTCQTVETWTRQLLQAQTLSRFGAREIPEEGNVRLRAYRSPIDCSLQTYSVSVPSAYDPAVPWPLIVSMHGHGWFAPYQGHPAPAYHGAFCLSPQGRGATDYRDLGELDVLQAIDEVCTDFNIDPDRVYLKGSSMGGTGAWNLGVHYADRFAGILPICGNADNQAWTLRWQWNEPFSGRFDQLREALQESHTSRAFAGNLLSLPSYIMHGAGDTVVPPEHARSMAAELQRLDCPFQYREYPNVRHGGFNNVLIDDGLAWLCAQPRNAYPRRVRWQTATLRHGKAYWLRLEQMAQPLQQARIDATVEDSGNRVTVRTENILAFSIERNPGLFNDTQPLFVTVDGERVILPPAADLDTPWQTLRRDPETGWDSRQHREAPRQFKTAGVEGPIHDALMEPFVLVIGTQSAEPLINRLWRQEARQVATEWKRRNITPCPFVTDNQVTPELAASRNLICFGGAAHNSVSARLEGRLPMRRILTDLAAHHRLSDTPLDNTVLPLNREDVGFMTVYPNPDHPGRLVVIISGNGPAAIYQSWHRFGNWFNWGVYDSKKYFDYAVFDARSASPETMLALGYYGTDWSVDAGISFYGSDALRRRMAPQHFPAADSVPEGTDHLDLLTLRPRSIDQMRGAVGFGRTFQGLPLPLGIGVRAPATLEYDINGAFTSISAAGRLLNSPETGMPANRRNGEKVKFVIKGDNAVLASGVCSWDNPMVQLNADLTGVRKLRLEATPAGGPAWLHAGAAWLAPRLYRK